MCVLAGLCVMWGSAAYAEADPVWRVLLLQDRITRVVVMGVTALGLAGGVVGSFLLLRKRALLSDTVSHATLPGVCAGFVAMVVWGDSDGKALVGLLVGAGVFGLLAIGAVQLITRTTRVKDDAALAIVLSVSFGLGVAMLNMVSEMGAGSAAGLGNFILGRAATMRAAEAWVIVAGAVVVTAVCVLLFKELTLVSFDEELAGSQGWPVSWIDGVLMVMVVAVTVVGLRAVGVVLVVAMLIIPPAAARFWTEDLKSMAVVSAVLGAGSGYAGAVMSFMVQKLPTGPVIVLVAAGVFGFSMLVGAKRGVLVRWRRHLRLTQRVGMQHLLRAAWEHAEMDPEHPPFYVKDLLPKRSWSVTRLRRLVARAKRMGLVYDRGAQIQLTQAGQREAEQVVRNHRLWEMYLITHADIAPSHVDRDADMIEHVLGREMVDRLEALLAPSDLPASPHELKGRRSHG